MRAGVMLALQVVVSLVILGAVFPAVLATLPPARELQVGLPMMAGLLLIVFVLLRLVWPKPKAKPEE